MWGILSVLLIILAVCGVCYIMYNIMHNIVINARVIKNIKADNKTQIERLNRIAEKAESAAYRNGFDQGAHSIVLLLTETQSLSDKQAELLQHLLQLASYMRTANKHSPDYMRDYLEAGRRAAIEIKIVHNLLKRGLVV